MDHLVIRSHSCVYDVSFHVLQAEPLSYIGPGEIIGIGVLAFVIILLLILFIAFRKKIKFRKESDQGLGTQPVMGVSAVSTETSYMLHKTGMGVEGIEFKAVRLSGSPGTTSTYGEVGSSTGGPPQVMVRPTAHSPLPGGISNQGMRSGDHDKPTASEGSQVCTSARDNSFSIRFFSVCPVSQHDHLIGNGDFVMALLASVTGNSAENKCK